LDNAFVLDHHKRLVEGELVSESGEARVQKLSARGGRGQILGEYVEQRGNRDRALFR
jgi:hypothetical protein